MAEFVEIGGAWKKTDRRGNTYLSLSLKTKNGNVPLFVRKNDFKKKDMHPDYKISATKEGADSIGLVYGKPSENRSSVRAQDRKEPRYDKPDVSSNQGSEGDAPF